MTRTDCNSFVRDKQFTIENFAKFVSPILKRVFETDKVVDSESLSDNLSRCLDKEFCVDGYFERDGAFEFFSSRIQNGDYRTFTIRKNRDSGKIAEYERLCRQFREGRIYPRWAIQAYVSGDSATVAIVETRHLLNFIREKKAGIKRTREDKHGQAEFFIIAWSALQRENIPVQIFDVTTHGETKKTA